MLVEGQPCFKSKLKHNAFCCICCSELKKSKEVLVKYILDITFKRKPVYFCTTECLVMFNLHYTPPLGQLVSMVEKSAFIFTAQGFIRKSVVGRDDQPDTRGYGWSSYYNR